MVTETDSALRQGTYVKGIVLLICRKRKGDLMAYREDLAWEIQEEVEEQVKHLMGLNQEVKGGCMNITYEIDKLPFFKGYLGENEAVIDVSLFKKWLKKTLEEEVITEEELKEAEKFWEEYLDGRYKTLDELEKELS